MSHLTGLPRAEASRAIRRGRVSVDGATVRDPAARADGAVALDGEPLVEPPRLAVLHKPVDVQSTVGDPRGRTSLAEVAAPLLALGLHPVGRLDADTSGLLPFSADGRLTQRLLHPRHAVEKVYEARVEGHPGAELAERLTAGVRTALGVHVARVLAVDGPTVRLAVTEGKHRMVRRMLANCGHPVIALHRVRFGPLELGDLAPGDWRPARPEELEAATALLA